MNRRLTKAVVLAGMVALRPSAAAAQATTHVVDCAAGATIQAAIDVARPGDTIRVGGTCNENLRILDEVSRITLDGRGSARIHGPNARANTVLVAGRNITIRGFTITGGRNGIAVIRGGMALIESNTIQEAAENGINVAQHSFAGILDNAIQLNHDAGIRMLDASDARIGFMDLAQPARGNYIWKNGGAGVQVHGSSGASLVGNLIGENEGAGVAVSGSSHADVAANRIDGNASDGVTVTLSSDVQLGGLPGLLDPANETSVPNGGFGLACAGNSSVGGQLGSLTGVAGGTKFDSSCSNGPKVR